VRPTLPVIAVLSAALLAAVAAHVGIDVLGDFLVRDDSYDHVAHGSRELFTIVALLLAAGAGAHLFSRMCAAASSIRMRVRFLRLSGKGAIRFSASVSLVALILVPAMETIDALRAGADVDSLADAFGSSLLLGVSVTLACALLCCAIIVGLAAWLCRHRESVARIIYELLAVAPPVLHYASETRTRDAIAVYTHERRTRRRTKRGPPLAAMRASVLTLAP
jgi:hypothetical protein